MEVILKIRKGKFLSRGIRLHDMKYLAKDIPIEVMPAPEIVAISLGQHIGKPAVPVIKEGDFVYQGQLIAQADGPISANVYSSVSGTVEGFEKRPVANGAIKDYILIRNDGNYMYRPLSPLPDREKETVIARIREAGIVGMGGAGFPTAVKLAPKQTPDILVINGAECEPYLTCDYRLMVEKTDEVAQGIRLIAKALGVTKIVVGIEKNKPDCIEKFASYEDFEIVVLRKAYPMGSEKHLIYSCTGRKVPVGKLPSDVGCVVNNIATAYAVYEAVELDKPLFERVMTVSGKGIVHPANLLVKNGTRFDDIITHCGGLRDTVAMLVSGGPMMGPCMISTDLYSGKTDSGILALDNSETDSRNPSPCINCGACAEVCPMHLLPMMIDFYTQARDYQKAREVGGVDNCISCGCCSYVCPARRAIVQSITLCKQKLASKG